jgi:hypothetical protein
VKGFAVTGVRGRAVAALLESGRPVPDPEGPVAGLVATLSREDFGPSAVKVAADDRLFAR